MNDSSVHALPFHWITAPDVLTAMQAFVALQDMPQRKLPSLGFGVGSIVQAVPFHRSANADEPEAPTAMQTVSAVHDTAFNWPPPLGVGVGWIVHAVPFHRSASVEAPE